jgi:cupin fold WbuC family metalloprotein
LYEAVKISCLVSSIILYGLFDILSFAIYIFTLEITCMIHINRSLTDDLIQQARSSSRKRKNYNFHESPSDPLHRMLHAMEPETYVQPHKHDNPDKREAFIVLKGRVAVIEYSDQGNVKDFIILDPVQCNFGVEIPPRAWHNLIVLESGTVVYEVKDGPWDPADDKYFATWAPREGDEECVAYNIKVLKSIGIEL